jgi:RNA polymerase sigma factor (sigma-70 family)
LAILGREPARSWDGVRDAQVNTSEPQRLNEIATHWTQVQQAVLGEGPAAAEAQRELFERYGGAMRRYLQAALTDASAVDDLLQDFAVALVSGGFRGLQPERGRFRDYVKGVLFRLVQKHRRREQRQPRQLPADIDLTDPESFPGACEEQFRQSWRDELLARTWQELAQAEPSYFTVLHFRAAHPDMPSDKMVGELAPQLGKPLTAPGVRQKLHRARKRFSNLLLQQVAASLELPTPGAIHEELRELDLSSFVLTPRKG